MTTLTSRSLPLVPLQLNLSALSGGGIGGENGNGSTLMRPLHNHANNNCLPSDGIRLTPKEERLSPNSRYGSESSLKNSICDIDQRHSDPRKLVNGGLTHADDMSDARSSSVSSYQADSFHKDQDDDQMSYCSDESELSVGKEVESEQRFSDRGKHLTSDMETESVDDLIPERTIINNNDDVSNDAMRYTAKIPNIIRPSPTRLQEEFLRKSQMYAEELMKHQMNFMAATRGLNISPKISEHTFGYPVRPDALSPIRSNSDEAKIGFRPHIRDRANTDLEKKWSTIDDRSSQSPEGTHFRGIHSHLNAISKITSALGRDMAQLTSPGSITSRENSQSPPNHHYHQMLNNNMNDTNLKFSIDNILKPGFGRRITDPLLKRNKTTRKNAQRSVTNNNEKHVGTPIDLTATMVSACTTVTAATTAISPPPRPISQATSTGSVEQDKSPSNNNTSKSSSSGGPMVWPAWVYCTRYSDRPSSGKLFI